MRAHSPSLAHNSSTLALGGAVHFDHGGPGAVEAFGLPLSGGVDAHFAAVVGQAAGVVERVDRAEGELNIAFRVDVVGDTERDFADVLDVAILVDNDDDLGETWPGRGTRWRS